MNAHEFTFVLDHTTNDDEIDALYEAGCDDATPVQEEARTLLHFHREAASLAEALVSALRDVERTGLHVAAVDTEDLVTVKDIAARTERSYESVRLLANGQRGPGGFPPPMSSGGWTFYSWAQVAAWFTRHFPGTGHEQSTEYDRVIAAADHLVRARAILAGDDAGARLAQLIA